MTETIKNTTSKTENIKVLDATVRDGGLCNSFAFTDAFVKALYQANLRCGVDYMELGYRASRRLFPEAEFGKWNYCHEDDLFAVIGENNTALKLAVMADVGRCDYKADFGKKGDSIIDTVRVACYADQIPEAADMIEHLHTLGYETTCNVMAISTASQKALENGLTILRETPVDVIYPVDSYGALYPTDVRRLTEQFLAATEGTDKRIGFHGHNNLGLALANTLEALACGARFVDATVGSLGRGAGNCAMDLLLNALKNPKYTKEELLPFVENHLLPLKDEVAWGGDLAYMLTGLFNKHPKAAIEFIGQQRRDYLAFYHEMQQ